jgi:DNA-binding MarR family transcriptional regulator
MKKHLRSPRAERSIRMPLDTNRGPARLDIQHLRRLAEFRYRLRLFLHVSQGAAEEMGLRTQQYQLLQCVGGMPEGIAPTIADVAARMLLKHNSAVELVDRSVKQGLLRRSGDDADHRRILLRVTPRGERILASLSQFHTRELEQSGPELVRALDRIVRGAKPSPKRGQRMPKEKAVAR